MVLKTKEIDRKSSQEEDAWGVPRRWGERPQASSFLRFRGSFLLLYLGFRKRQHFAPRSVRVAN